VAVYGREALRQFREQQARQPERGQPSLLDQIPADAPMDDATLTVWNGERWVAWDRWLATAPLVREEALQPSGSASPPIGRAPQPRAGRPACGWSARKSGV
jgi:hypothetical protein